MRKQNGHERKMLQLNASREVIFLAVYFNRGSQMVTGFLEIKENSP